MKGIPKSAQLEVVVGWLPRVPERSLASGARALIPAVLYADRVTVICPQSDDAVEMSDYSDLKKGVPEVVQFLALDSMYARLDDTGEAVERHDGSYYWEPLAPRVWEDVVNRHLALAREAASQGDLDVVDKHAACASVLLRWGQRTEAEQLDVLADGLPDVARPLLAAAMANAETYRSEVTGEWLLGALAERSSQVGRYALLDDPAGLLSAASRAQMAPAFDEWARRRSAEVTLSAKVLGILPSPTSQAPWDEVGDVRQRLGTPLVRFRAAMAELSEAADVHPLQDDFDHAVEHILRTQVSPALAELEDMVRDSALRQVFFRDVLGDLASYAGPLLGLGAATSDAVPDLMSLAVGAASPLARTIAHRAEKRRAVQRHRFLFVREVAHRLRTAD